MCCGSLRYQIYQNAKCGGSGQVLATSSPGFGPGSPRSADCTKSQPRRPIQAPFRVPAGAVSFVLGVPFLRVPGPPLGPAPQGKPNDNRCAVARCCTKSTKTQNLGVPARSSQHLLPDSDPARRAVPIAQKVSPVIRFKPRFVSRRVRCRSY